MGFVSILKFFIDILNAKLIVDSYLNLGFITFLQVFFIINFFGNKAVKFKYNGNIYNY